MTGQILTWWWLAHAAVGGMIVLALGSMAVRLCREPVRRARLVVLTLLGALLVPWLGTIPLAPRWSAPPIPILVTLRPREPATTRTGPPHVHLESNTHGDPLNAHPNTVVHSGNGLAVGRSAESTYSHIVNLPWRRFVLAAYAFAAAALLAWWVAGQAMLWRITHRARPVSSSVRAQFDTISGPAGRRVRLLESDRIKLPFTFTWARPVILLPAALGAVGDEEALRYCLAHEWSHVERHDAWTWNLAVLAGVVLFYQPLFWWLRRQLRLCQDYLADDRAAVLGSSEDYAAYLVRLARGRPSGTILPALSVIDRPSNLYRRVFMLVTDRESLEHRCPRSWSFAAAALAALAILVASGFRLDASDAPATPKAAAENKVSSDRGRTWTGRVVDKESGQPIVGADVLVRVSVSRDKKSNQERTLRDVRQTTDVEGKYHFTISPEEADEPLLYITLEVEAPDQVRYFGGYSYGMILKNEALGERPFYEKLELAPGKAIEGRLLTPEGKPAAGVKVQAFSARSADRLFEGSGWAETKTDANGTFRLVLHRKGPAVFWLLPKDYVPSTHGLKNDRRGDMGVITLAEGVRLGGRVLDAKGKAVAGVYVGADHQRQRGGDDDPVPNGVADMIHRAVVTAADGTFTFGPLPPGKYRVMPDERGWDPSTREGAIDPERRPLPAVFTPHTLTLEEGKTPEPIEIRAAPHVVVEAQIYDSKGKTRGGHDVWFSGKIDGGFWSANSHPTADGKFVILAPHGLEDAMISLMTNEHSCLQFRLANDAPLVHSRTIRLGTLDHDVKGIEIIRYEAPIILVQATTKEGQPVKDVRVSVDYTEPGNGRDGKYILKGGGRSDVSLEEMGNGRFRTSQLAPDREVNVTAQAAGFLPASRKVTLPEGKTEELTLVLEPK